MRVDGAVDGGGDPEYTAIGATRQTYRNVDSVSFVTDDDTRVVDNGDGSYTISGLVRSYGSNVGEVAGVRGLQIGGGATSWRPLIRQKR